MIKPTQALRRRHFRALYGPISGARQCCGPLDPGALSGVMWLPHGPQSPNKPVTSAPWGPGKPGKATRSQASASSTASLSPCARHPRPRPRRLRRPRGRCSSETRSQPALQQPPGRASPTFSGQEGGRPRAHFLLCSRNGRRRHCIHTPSGVSGRRPKCSPLQGGRSAGVPAPRFARGGAPRPEPALPRAAGSRAGTWGARRRRRGRPPSPKGFSEPGHRRGVQVLEEALAWHEFLSLIFNVIPPPRKDDSLYH